MSTPSPRGSPPAERIEDPNPEDVLESIEWVVTSREAGFLMLSVGSGADLTWMLVFSFGAYWLPHVDADQEATVEELAERYPDDPQPTPSGLADEGASVHIDASVDEHQELLTDLLREVYGIEPREVTALSKEETLSRL